MSNYEEKTCAEYVKSEHLYDVCRAFGLTRTLTDQFSDWLTFFKVMSMETSNINHTVDMTKNITEWIYVKHMHLMELYESTIRELADDGVDVEKILEYNKMYDGDTGIYVDSSIHASELLVDLKYIVNNWHNYRYKYSDNIDDNAKALELTADNVVLRYVEIKIQELAE